MRKLTGTVLAGVTAAIVGCSGTGPSCCDPPPVEPTGWIYFTPSLDLYPIARLRVETGVVEPVTFPPPVNPAALPPMTFWSGMASPIDGSIAMMGSVGQFWPQTFVYHRPEATVTIHGDGERAAVDNRHTWSPDGRWVVFKRHLATGSPVHLVRLEPATGIQDTLVSAIGFQISKFFWVGSDSVAFYYISHPEESGWRVAGGKAQPWGEFDLIPDAGFIAPTVSADRKWVAYWSVEDSLVSGEGTVEFTRLRLRNRFVGSTEDFLIWEGRFGTVGNLDHVFSGDSRFLAWCASETELAIRDLIREKEVKRMPVPFCWSLSWSKGEGEPA